MVQRCQDRACGSGEAGGRGTQDRNSSFPGQSTGTSAGASPCCCPQPRSGGHQGARSGEACKRWRPGSRQQPQDASTQGASTQGARNQSASTQSASTQGASTQGAQSGSPQACEPRPQPEGASQPR